MRQDVQDSGMTGVKPDEEVPAEEVSQVREWHKAFFSNFQAAFPNQQ